MEKIRNDKIKKFPFVSIIVLNYNGKHYLEGCFSSVRKINYQKNRYEVIMGDNGSFDDSVEYVRKNFPWVKVLQFDKNYGFAEGNNKCVEDAKGEYVVFLNNDTKVDRQWLIELVKGFDFDPKVAICGSKLLFYDNPDVINSAGGKITFIGGGCDIGFGKKNQKKFNDYNFAGYICGASLMMKKLIFKQLGRFDSDYFAYCEDVDLCWRAWLYGYKVLYVPSSKVLHKFGGGFGGIASPNRIYYTQRNRLITIVKNLETLNFIKSLIMSLGYDFYQVFIFIKKIKPGLAKLIVMADYSIMRNLPKFLMKRKEIQGKRKLSDKQLTEKQIFSPLFRSFKEKITQSRFWRT